MNLLDLNHPICEWLNLEKKKRIKKIKVKKCIGVVKRKWRKEEKKKKKKKRKRKKESSVECFGVLRKW